jgi:hypothetical protein
MYRSLEQQQEKKIRVRFLRDSVADRRDFLAGDVADIPSDDAYLLAQRRADGRGPSVMLLSSNI